MDRIEVTVTGPTGCGKSLVLAAIDRAIRGLGTKLVLSEDLEKERRLNNPDNPPDWELESLRTKTYVVLTEKNIPRESRHANS